MGFRFYFPHQIELDKFSARGTVYQDPGGLYEHDQVQYSGPAKSLNEKRQIPDGTPRRAGNSKPECSRQMGLQLGFAQVRPGGEQQHGAEINRFVFSLFFPLSAVFFRLLTSAVK